jgi:hypothetical protein
LLLVSIHFSLCFSHDHFINITLGNANEECHPQEETEIAKLGIKVGMKGYGYLIFAIILFGCFWLLCCIIVLFFYIIDRRKNHGINLTPAMEQKRKDEEHAVSKIGKDSVYSYFVTNSKFGWLAAFATVLLQAGILVFFLKASEPELQDDAIDIKFAWICPRDTVVCKDTGIVGNEAWFIFYVLMAAFLAKDIISGMKLIYLSSKRRHDLWSRFRYFIGGMLLCSITLFAVYVSCSNDDCHLFLVNLFLDLIGTIFSLSLSSSGECRIQQGNRYDRYRNDCEFGHRSICDGVG